MKELKIGEQTVRVKASPLALLYYKQEFNSDLLGDIVKMKDMENDPSKLDTVAILQLVWAMAKTEVGPKFPSFSDWLSGFDRIDITEENFLKAALEEAADGFFRRGKSQLKK